MASSKKEAQNYLGSENDYINLSGLNQERQLANDVYNTNTKSFQNAYNDLLSTLATNRSKAKTDFGSGRATVNENSYLQNRNNISELSKGLSNSGVSQLNKIGNRMETGRQYSDLANTYYNTMNELDANEKTYTNEYNTNLESAKNTLNASLAGINSRESAGRNAYKTAVAQLAEQIQARKDAAAAAAKAYALQKQQYEDSVNSALLTKLSTLAGDGTDAGKMLEAARYYMNATGSTMHDALQFMNKYGIYTPDNIKTTSSNKSNTSSKYSGPLTATDISTGGRFIKTDSNGNRYF